MANKNKGMKHVLDKMTYDKPEFNIMLKNVTKSIKEVQKILDGKKKK